MICRRIPLRSLGTAHPSRLEKPPPLEYCTHIQSGLSSNIQIDDSDFGCLGIPSPLEMYQQQCVLLVTEIEEHQVDLRQCRANIAKLVTINAQVSAEWDSVKHELACTKRMLSDAYLRLSTVENALVGYRSWQARLAANEAAKPPADH